MTSPALLVLFLAHACSILGTASEGNIGDDHSITSMQTNKHNIWTNIYKNLDETNEAVYDDIYHDDILQNNLNTENHKFEMRQFNEKMVVENVVNAGDGVYTENNKNMNLHNLKFLNRMRRNENKVVEKTRKFNEIMEVKNRVKRDENDPRCKPFKYSDLKDYITHPHSEDNPNLYFNNSDCTTIIYVPEGNIMELTFVDKFRIEYHPDCAYDYLEIRDGNRGYSDLLDKVCGEIFPRVMKTRGPYAWLKFHSDDTIEYEGFIIKVKKLPVTNSYSVPADCEIVLPEARSGVISSKDISQKCKDGSANHGLDVLWTINTPSDTKIFLNFTNYELQSPNECDKNGIQIFGSVLELSSQLEYYCGSVANPVTSKGDKGDGNLMHVRLYTSKSSDTTKFEAKYTSFRSTNPSKDTDACRADEFDCADNTCIDLSLKCDGDANCRLKTDEDEDICTEISGSPIKQPHILVILVIFSLILSTMMFVFLFKCTRKLYQDHKIIKEHIRQSCEDRLDRLDSLVGSRLTLDAKRLQRDSEPRASLERENHANEMFKRKRDSFSKRKQPTSIDSDFQETHIDLDEEIWRRDVVQQIEPEDILIERNGRTRRRDTSAKEESIRSKKETEERKEIRDVSVGAPDTKESGCQTRESLFQTDPPPSSDGKSSSSNSRGFSTFGYSGATIARPSPPTNTSEITIELLKQVPRQDSKPQKKIDRRPMSTETTRSAPDVIIVSKPIR